MAQGRAEQARAVQGRGQWYGYFLIARAALYSTVARGVA